MPGVKHFQLCQLNFIDMALSQQLAAVTKHGTEAIVCRKYWMWETSHTRMLHIIHPLKSACSPSQMLFTHFLWVYFCFGNVRCHVCASTALTFKGNMRSRFVGQEVKSAVFPPTMAQTPLSDCAPLWKCQNKENPTHVSCDKNTALHRHQYFTTCVISLPATLMRISGSD